MPGQRGERYTILKCVKDRGVQGTSPNHIQTNLFLVTHLNTKYHD
jgi:hypothetical protein